MIPPDVAGVILALLSAGTWGSGDFFGGFTTQRFYRYSVLVVSALAGILILILCHLIWPEPFPAFPGFLWAILAGVFGFLGLSTLYTALTLGHSALVAPTAAVLGAAIPVLFGIYRDGLPDGSKLIGFALAFAGIWFVSRVSSETLSSSNKSLSMAILAGIGFGGFFICITLSAPDLKFTPLILSRSTFFSMSAIFLLIYRGKMKDTLVYPYVWLTGFFDAGGNMLFMLAKQFTRMDVAVILSSLYPGITVLLSWIILKERINRWQWIGVCLCFAAVILISA